MAKNKAPEQSSPNKERIVRVTTTMGFILDMDLPADDNECDAVLQRMYESGTLLKLILKKEPVSDGITWTYDKTTPPPQPKPEKKPRASKAKQPVAQGLCESAKCARCGCEIGDHEPVLPDPEHGSICHYCATIKRTDKMMAQERARQADRPLGPNQLTVEEAKAEGRRLRVAASVKSQLAKIDTPENWDKQGYAIDHDGNRAGTKHPTLGYIFLGHGWPCVGCGCSVTVDRKPKNPESFRCGLCEMVQESERTGQPIVMTRGR